MPYTPTYLKTSLAVRELFSVHYFEYTSNYRFAGESHDFWELLYVDNGTVQVVADDQQYSLSRGQLIFHAPGEFHALSANGVVAPNLVVIGFGCSSPAMKFFKGRLTFAGAAERALLARIVEESTAVFSTPLNNPTTTQLIRRPDAPVFGEQFIANALEELLLRLIRQGESLPSPGQHTSHQTNLTMVAITEYLNQRLDQPLTVDQICRDNMIGRSQMQKLFHDHTGGGVIEYFSNMKIKAARQMIREGHLNVTQISAKLGFQSVHYFSRRFKELTGMSPREYSDSVKMLAEASQSLSDNRANKM